MNDLDRCSIHSKHEAIRRLRFGDIKKLLRERYQHTLPDDDAGREDLELLLDCVSFVPNARFRMKNAIEIWAPWMGAAESYQLVEAVLRKPDYLRKINATDLGEKVNLTWDERQRLKIRTIAPAISPDEFAQKRKERRKARERARMRHRRRKAGVMSRTAYLATSKSKMRPWKAEGISRRTWERRRRALTQPCRKSVRT